MKSVIINADDFGYSPAVNAGIIKAYEDGILTSTTLMANMPGCDHAITLCKSHPGLGVGAHLTLTCGYSLTQGKTISQQGRFYNLKNYQLNRSKMDDEEIYEEWCTQIDYLLAHDVKLTHLDSHHHLHAFKENYEITLRIAQKYGLPFRNVNLLEDNFQLPYQKNVKGLLDLCNYPHIRDISHSFKSDQNACLNEIEAVLKKIGEGVTELMVHPAYVDETLYFQSSFNIARIKEVSLLCDEDVAQLFNKYQIQMCHYGTISGEKV